MFQYFSKAERARRKIMNARWEIIVSDAFQPGEPGQRLSDQLGRYSITPSNEIDDIKFEEATMRLLYNEGWVNGIDQSILIAQLYAQVPDSGHHCFLRP